MKLQHLAALLFAAAFMIFGYTLLNSSALPKFWAMRQKKIRLIARVEILKSRVEEQKQSVFLLSAKSPRSLTYLDSVARNEYGFVGNQETMLLIQ